MKHLFCVLCVLALFSHSSFNLAALAAEPYWNQFRGPNSDNHSASTGIAKSWSAEGPNVLWTAQNLGRGYSSISIYGDRIFTMGDFNIDGAWHNYVIAINRANGEELWRTRTGRGGDGGGNHPSPLSTPATDGESVFVMSQFGDFVALNAANGAIRWRKNMPSEYGAVRMASWGFSMSPIIDGDKVLLPIGGEGGTLAAFSKDGELLWRTYWITDRVAYTSVVPVEIEGVRQYMLLTGQRLVGVSTEGEFLWGANFPGSRATCSDPVISGNVIMASQAYTVGAYFYRISRSGDRFSLDYFHGPDTTLQSHHGGMVAVGDYIYLLTSGRDLACVRAATGEVVWRHRSVGTQGSLTYVDGMLILRSERDGATIALVEATPEGYRERGRFDQPYRSDGSRSAWAYPVVFDNRLYIRDDNVLICFDLN